MAVARLYWHLGLLYLDGQIVATIEPRDEWWRAPVGRALHEAGYTMPRGWANQRGMLRATARRLPKRADTDPVPDTTNRKAT